MTQSGHRTLFWQLRPYCMLMVDQDMAGERMRIAILDDVHRGYEGTTGVSRLRDRGEVQIFTGPFGDPAVLRSFDAIVANRERTRFTRDLLQQLPNLKIIAQTGNHSGIVESDGEGRQ